MVAPVLRASHCHFSHTKHLNIVFPVFSLFPKKQQKQQQSDLKNILPPNAILIGQHILRHLNKVRRPATFALIPRDLAIGSCTIPR